MKFKNLYEITHETKRGGLKRYIIHIEAFTQKEAIEQAKTLWYNCSNAHMFNVSIRNVPLGEIIDFKHWFFRIK